MEIQYSKSFKLTIDNIDDYNIGGTFSPDAACDTEFFGFRETIFTIESGTCEHNGIISELSEGELNYFRTEVIDEVERLVQYAIDDKQGEL